MKCLKHPKYKAKRAPKTLCGTCLCMYIQRKKFMRMPIPPPTKIVKSKKSYTRKEKHK